MFINCPQLPICVKTLKQNITVVLKQSGFVISFFFFPKISSKQVYIKQVLMCEWIFTTVHVQSYLYKLGIDFKVFYVNWKATSNQEGETVLRAYNLPGSPGNL